MKDWFPCDCSRRLTVRGGDGDIVRCPSCQRLYAIFPSRRTFARVQVYLRPAGSMASARSSAPAPAWGDAARATGDAVASIGELAGAVLAAPFRWLGVILAALLLCAMPAQAHDLDLCHDGRSVALSTTTWALISERDELQRAWMDAAREELSHAEAELAIRRAITASVAAALRVGVDASRDLGACLAREADAEARALACETGRLGPVELAAGAGGAAVAGALVGVLACGVVR